MSRGAFRASPTAALLVCFVADLPSFAPRAGDLIGVGPFLYEAFEFLFAAADVEALKKLLEPAIKDLAYLLLG